MHKRSIIKKLPSWVANQIAAGEVIERPASLLKELLENSLDAKSTQIDVKITQGGLGKIEVIDNGEGIYQEDLALALCPNATSKITTTDDLAEIFSLGFRGEALASISAVARLKIISKPQAQDHACEIIAELTSEQYTPMPAARGNGTTIIVEDLFCHIPARRKFLKSLRTEQMHLDNVFKKIALSHFDVGFSYSDQDKTIFQLPPCHNEKMKIARLKKLLGSHFEQYSLMIDYEHNGRRLYGWIAAACHTRTQADQQFFYLNKRSIRDKVINHAIGQCYLAQKQIGRHPFYCLFLEIDPKTVDVNVHPTKHEVRFRESRSIHAFISEALNNVQEKKISSSPSQQASSAPKEITQESIPVEPVKKIEKFRVDKNYLIINKLLLLKEKNQLLIIDLQMAQKQLIIKSLGEGKQKPLLFPHSVFIEKNITKIIAMFPQLRELQFDLDQLGAQTIVVRAVPKILVGYEVPWQQLLSQISENNINKNQEDLIDEIAKILSKDDKIPEILIEDIMTAIEQRSLDSNVCKIVNNTDLRSVLFS